MNKWFGRSDRNTFEWISRCLLLYMYAALSTFLPAPLSSTSLTAASESFTHDAEESSLYCCFLMQAMIVLLILALCFRCIQQAHSTVVAAAASVRASSSDGEKMLREPGEQAAHCYHKH